MNLNRRFPLAPRGKKPAIAGWQKAATDNVEQHQNWLDQFPGCNWGLKTGDGFVVLDTAKKSRCNLDRALRETDWSSGRPVVNIDHHATNTRFGDVNWVVETAASTVTR